MATFYDHAVAVREPLVLLITGLCDGNYWTTKDEDGVPEQPQA
jgi:hypothetical protein